jgi:hypothetical protein
MLDVRGGCKLVERLGRGRIGRGGADFIDFRCRGAGENPQYDTTVESHTRAKDAPGWGTCRAGTSRPDFGKPVVENLAAVVRVLGSAGVFRLLSAAASLRSDDRLSRGRARSGGENPQYDIAVESGPRTTGALVRGTHCRFEDSCRGGFQSAGCSKENNQ